LRLTPSADPLLLRFRGRKELKRGKRRRGSFSIAYRSEEKEGEKSTSAEHPGRIRKNGRGEIFLSLKEEGGEGGNTYYSTFKKGRGEERGSRI